VEGVNYEVNWRNFKRGYSIFIPCLDCYQVKQDIFLVLKRLRKRAIAKNVVEDGIRGLRVWRV